MPQRAFNTIIVSARKSISYIFCMDSDSRPVR
jgi:hypothetical protein